MVPPKFNAIMEGHELRACEKNVALLGIFHLGLDRFDHLTRIAPSYHKDGTNHDLPLAVERHRPMANG